MMGNLAKNSITNKVLLAGAMHW